MIEIDWSSKVKFAYTAPWCSFSAPVQAILDAEYPPDLLARHLRLLRGNILTYFRDKLHSYAQYRIQPQHIHEFLNVFDNHFVAYVALLPASRSKILLQVELLLPLEAEYRREQLSPYKQIKRVTVTLPDDDFEG